MKLSEVIDRVIQLAGNVAEERAAMGRTFNTWDVAPGTRSTRETELVSFLDSLLPSTIYKLMAVMYLGRGDFETTADLLGAFEHVSDNYSKRGQPVDALLEKTPLADYQIQARRKLTAASIDIDTILA